MKTMPTTSYTSPFVKQIQEDGSWKIIGETHLELGNNGTQIETSSLYPCAYKEQVHEHSKAR